MNKWVLLALIVLPACGAGSGPTETEISTSDTENDRHAEATDQSVVPEEHAEVSESPISSNEDAEEPPMPSWNSDLKNLMELVPPPEVPRRNNIDFAAVERGLGIEYPSDFKQFVTAYGSGKWCDYIILYYPSGDDPEDIEDFKSRVTRIFSEDLSGPLYNESYDEIELPYYPEKGGLFPFLVDSGGGWHFWIMEGSADEWPVATWADGRITIERDFNMTQMFVRWLEREEPALSMWGDVEIISPDGIRLD